MVSLGFGAVLMIGELFPFPLLVRFQKNPNSPLRLSGRSILWSIYPSTFATLLEVL